jgi:hypothetical protein
MKKGQLFRGGLPMKLGKRPSPFRPRPKPNEKAIRINPFSGTNFGSSASKSLGHVGNVETLVWLYCDLQTHGKVIIRQGWREGLPKDKPPIWVFCPLLAFPRDRKLVEECKGCPHYHGASKDAGTINQPKPSESEFKVNVIRPRKNPPKKTFTKEDVEKWEETKREEDRKWLDEERRLTGNGTAYD